ncbi:MAG: hypothetical protein LBQ10_06140 [Desulfovibrio sp.]|jgi:hypothetical protein|nr:hypothetical protein [Desulfovibrio sp.]
MNLRTAAWMIGNGSRFRGHDIVCRIARRCRHAREKHPVFAEGLPQAVGVIAEEMRELEQAMLHEGPERTVEESLDVIATAIRLVNGEHEESHGEKS